LRGVMLAGHGIICWGDSAEACYENTIDLIARAAAYLNQKMEGKSAFGGLATTPLPAQDRAKIAAKLMPRLRGAMQGQRPKVGHFTDDP